MFFYLFIGGHSYILLILYLKLYKKHRHAALKGVTVVCTMNRPQTSLVSTVILFHTLDFI